MAVTAEQAIRAWGNSRQDLIGDGNPVARGFYLRTQRSPASGVYGVISRTSTLNTGITAEPAAGLDVARISVQFRSTTSAESAEDAAVAYAGVLQTDLTGIPAPCGDTGVWIRSHDTLIGPFMVPEPPGGEEPWCFQCDADFLLQATG